MSTKGCPFCDGRGESWLDTGWHRGHATGHFLHCTHCDGTGETPVLVQIGETIARKALAGMDADLDAQPKPLVDPERLAYARHLYSGGRTR